jgi:putative ABC transport system permease protein
LLDESANRARFIHIRINPENSHQAIDQIETLWNKYYPGQELNYFFLDDQIKNQYKAETILSRILSTFSVIGILICMIGLSALSLFISQQRTKEIGIRKVNGARILEIMKMLNIDFLRWSAISFIVAIPVALYIMNKWIENFAYKTTFSWWIFALTAFVITGIIILTVSLQSWKAASGNPVETLRYE